MGLKEKSQQIGARLTELLGGEGEYRMALLDLSHLKAVMDLQQTIIEELSRNDMLQPFPEDFMRAHIGEKGQIIGVFYHDELIAFRNIYFPDPDDEEWNLGIDLECKGKNLERIANLQMVCVHPDHRGKSLALRMNNHVIKTLREVKTHRYLSATVSPYNYWNVRILLNCGFVIKKLKDKYSGKLRYIVLQDLFHPLTFSSEKMCTVNLLQFEEQKRLLAEGYAGTRIQRVFGFHAPHRKELSKGFELVFKLPER